MEPEDDVTQEDVLVQTVLDEVDEIPAVEAPVVERVISGEIELDEDKDDDASVASEELEIDIGDRYGSLPKSELTEMPVERQLAYWYALLPSVKADAVEELGGNSSCLISVEGLILRFATGREYGARPWTKAPQFLRLQFAIEKFLASLNELGIVQAKLVFFDCFKGLLVRQHASLWAFREAFRANCIVNPHTLPSATFSSWLDPEYDQFMERGHVLLFFLEDGSALQPPQTVFDNNDDEEEAGSEASSQKVEEKVAVDHGYTSLYSLLLNTSCRGVNVSLLYKMTRAGRRLKTFCIFPNSGLSDLDSHLQPAIKQQLEMECSILDEFAPASQISFEVYQKSQLPLRLFILANCAREVLSSEEEEIDAWALCFFKTVLIHDIALRSTKLVDRSLNMVDLEECLTYSNTMEFLMANLGWFVSQLNKNAVAIGSENAEEIADLFDERVIRALFFAMFESESTSIGPDFFGFPKSLVELLENCWTFISCKEPFFPIRLDELYEEGGFFADLKALPFLCKSLARDVELEPKVLPVLGSDYLQQMLDRKVNAEGLIPGVLSLEDQKTVAGYDKQFQEFLKDESSWDARFFRSEKVNNSAPKKSAKKDSSQLKVIPENSEEELHYFWTADAQFDVAEDHLNAVARRADGLPRAIERKTGEDRERAIRRWQLRKEQESKVFARNINKYFGGLDRLHLPIVLIGGHAATDHPWLSHLTTEPSEKCPSPLPQLSSAQSGKKESGKKKGSLPSKTSTASTKASEGSGKSAGKSSKAAAIIASNLARQVEKKKSKEEALADSLYLQMTHVFKKRTSQPNIFYNAFLELLIGSRNAMDTTVLEDFGAVQKVLTLPENQVAFITTVAEKLMDPLEHTWKRKTILDAGQVRDILRVISLIFRFVQVSVDKLYKHMSGQQIRTFQTLLLMLGFERSARATFDLWATYRIGEMAKTETEKKKGSSSSSKKKSAAESVAIGGAEISAGRMSQLMKKLESDGLVVKTLRRFDFAIEPGTEARFQLKYLGQDFERTLGSLVDCRVTFKPDAWQKRLLDVVDSQESCLVVAPTASGKTFAAYYAMDKVLRFDNESCVLFVSPTRALALQVESEVIARFSGKTYPQTCKTTLCGHLLEDRQDNWNSCQILITVPSCLENVLSSNLPKMREWMSRVKYAIMDEIHCIGEEKAGKDWENLVQLLPCPFMALSATVGNESDFLHWLRRAQSLMPAVPVRFIKHDERYADLQTLYYSSKHHGLYNLNPVLCLELDHIRAKHQLTQIIDPIPNDALEIFTEMATTLKAKIAASKGGKCEKLSDGEKADLQFFITEFEPERYFQGTRAITKKQYRRFLHALFTSVETFAERSIIEIQDFKAIQERVGSATSFNDRRAGDLQPWWSSDDQKKEAAATATSPAAEAPAPLLRQVLPTAGQYTQCFNDPVEFLKLIRWMEEMRLMPALVFNFNRAFASRLFYRLANHLIDEHRAKYYGTPEAAARTKATNKKLQDDYKAMQARRSMAEKWKTLDKKQREIQGIDEQMLAELLGPQPPPPSDIAEEHDPDFFLCDRRMFLAMQEEFDGVIKMCKLDYYVKSGRIPPLLLEALRRGIGLYHEALTREYRRAVELLFRMRYLRIVVSDSSLSLGINMPCKTTVFAGDSPLLTPLLYRQTSGRAGRRGFDSLGHVLFWEFPFKKIRRLISSKLPILSGNYPVKPSAILRAMDLATSIQQTCIQEFISQRKGLPVTQLDPATIQKIDAARSKLQKIFLQPLFIVGASPSIKQYAHQNITMSYRFGVDILRRLGLLNEKGLLDSFGRLVIALMDEEPGNLFMVYALVRGAFRGREKTWRAAEAGGEPIAIPDNLLVHLLGFLIQRRDYHHGVVRRFELAAANPTMRVHLFRQDHQGFVTEKGLCMPPLLPPLPDKIADMIDQFDRLVFEIGVSRIKAMSLALNERRDSEFLLPMTSANFNKDDDAPTVDRDSPWAAWTDKASIPTAYTHYQSPFAALNGASGSDFATVEELILHCRDNIYLESGMVPQLNADKATIHLADHKTVNVPLLNSYAVDLLYHGKLRYIIETNDIPASEAYFILQALNSIMKRLSAVITSHITQRPAVSLASTSDVCTNAQSVSDMFKVVSSRFSDVYAKVRTVA